MDPKVLKQVIAHIHKRYPEFAGHQPRVRRQSPPATTTGPTEPTFLLTFNSTAVAKSESGSRSMPRYLRVVVDERGKILKVTTSR